MPEPTTDTTGQHALPPAAGLPTMLPPANGSQSKLLALVLTVASVVGGGSGYAASAAELAAERATTRSHLTELDRRVAAVEGQLVGIEPLRREVAALSATVSAQNAAIAQRLQRIEDAIDRQRAP